MLKPFPLDWCLQYDRIWLNKTFIQVKLFFICWIVRPIHFWYHLCWMNFLSQWWQLNGFSPVWSLSCTLRLSFWMNFLSQLNGVKQGFHQKTELNDFTSHALSGRPSGWISCHSGSNWMAFLKCALRLSFRTNSLSQWWQLKGFSLVWSLSPVNNKLS